MNLVYHPGEVLTIHWIRQTQSGDASLTPSSMTLKAALDGEFANVAKAKAAHATGGEQVSAKPVPVTDRTIAAPVSRIRIPASAMPGLYNLTTTVVGPGSTTSGTGIIRIAKH